MQYYTNYIGYKQTNKKIGVIAIAPLVVNLLPQIVSLFSGLFGGGAEADALKLVDSVKPQLQTLEPRDRLALVLAAAEQLNNVDARDIMVKNLFLWYKTNYPNDYKTLIAEDKEYYNNFLNTAIQKNPDGKIPPPDIFSQQDYYSASSFFRPIRQEPKGKKDGFKIIAEQSMFTNNEINYNQQSSSSITNSSNNVLNPNNVTTPINKTNISTTSNLLLYGGIGLGLLLILKKKKK
jgi:hypothetical protein